jgi:hypothetical protein
MNKKLLICVFFSLTGVILASDGSLPVRTGQISVQMQDRATQAGSLREPLLIEPAIRVSQPSFFTRLARRCEISDETSATLSKAVLPVAALATGVLFTITVMALTEERDDRMHRLDRCASLTQMCRAQINYCLSRT